MVLSRYLLLLGAKQVIAVDKQPLRYYGQDARLTVIEDYFEGIPLGSVNTLFLSWPVNYDNKSLILHVMSAKRVIYLGKNTEGTMCGTPALFRVLLQRRLLAYAPDRANSLIVTGGLRRKPRAPTGEEKAALSDSSIWGYAEAEAEAQ
jgi:hypothetical protein